MVLCLCIVDAICAIIAIAIFSRAVWQCRKLSRPEAIAAVIMIVITNLIPVIYRHINTIGSTETFTSIGVVEKTYIEKKTYQRSPNYERHFHTVLQYGDIYCDVNSEEIYRALEDAKGKSVDLEIRKDTLKNGRISHNYINLKKVTFLKV